jgi:pyruvate/2-oxoglutarate dehydrogenase complex dihydrolipoamide dehydrogenase (E3) component
MQRIIIVLLLAIMVAAWFLFDLGQYLTLDAVKAQQAAVADIYAARPVLVIGLFFLLYVLGEWVQSRFGDRLKAINAGVERDGAFYLFSLRLVPVFPFFLVNLLMGLTRIRTLTYMWVSQLGMLLGTIVYVNAGTQLAGINSLSGIASPAVIGSFVALGLLPFVGKGIMGALKRRRVYKGYDKPAKFDRNLIVIGAGAAGLVSSLIGATVRAKVTLVEASKMGGDCLNYGCVPSKALIKSAKVAQQMRHADVYGLNPATPGFSFRAVMARVHDIIKTIEPADSVERYTGLGVDVVKGYATIVDPWTVEIALENGGTQRLTTRSIIIAAGAAPIVPDLPGLDDVGYVTSDTLWETFAEMEDMPRRMVVLGGGPIGSELAQAFARLGAAVTQIDRGQRILPREDPEVSALALEAQRSSGVTVLTGATALRCEIDAGEKHIVIATADGEQRIAFDALILAVGRAARLTGYGLEKLGIETGKTVVTDEYLATLFPTIFACGDVAGPYQFTHVAAHQAWFASVNALFGQFKKFKADYRVIPWTTFIDPEIARVGLSEDEAKAQDIAYEMTRYDLSHLDRAIAESARTGFVKVLTVPGKDRILGVTIVGDHAGELLAEYVLAMKHGLGLNKILGTIHTYPTMSEANKYAAGEWKKARKPERLLGWVERYHDWRRG